MTDSAEAIVTVLSSAEPQSAAAQVLSTSRVELNVLIPFDIGCATAVKVEMGDMLLLGEVVCVEPRQAGYAVRLNIRHALNSLTDLMRLNRSILGQERPNRAQPEVVAVIAPRARTEPS